MKIGVISDTHLHTSSKQLESLIRNHFSDAEMILHAGDLIHMNVLKAFGEKPFYAVCGNMDDEQVTQLFPKKLVFEVRGFKFGLIHGWGNPADIEDRIRNEFDHVDCIVYGHTHIPCAAKKDGILFLNPGSPTDKRFSPYNSVGIIRVGSAIEGSIIPVS